MKRKILLKKPVIGAFHAPNGNRHSVAIAGYYDITVQYKKKKNDTKYASKTTRYYVVNARPIYQRKISKGACKNGLIRGVYDEKKA